ncbi:MAG: RagB/SusD family nutrient uptake outer membrane protein [Prevotella sp.]
MKKIYQCFLGVGLAAVLLTSFTSCMEETEPTTVATEDQIQQSPSSSESFLMAMPAYFNHFTDNGWHHGFGYGAMMYIRDLQTGDLNHSSTNYGSHFYYWARNQYQGDGYIFGQFIYNYYNEFVLAANNMVGAVNPENATDTQLGYLGAGLAFRALVYLDMARCYEFLPNDRTSNINVDGNDVLHLTVPITTAEMSQADATNNPRATREEMKEFIENDLNNAEKYIVNLSDTRGKVLPDLSCVYGLKARLYMWMEDYVNAEKYARLAINAATVDPMNETDCTNYRTGFNDITKWMWGSQMTSEDDVVQTGIINWTSWLSNQTTFGYTGYGASNMPFNCIDKNMYERISDTDFRKLEFKAPEGSPLASKVIQIPEVADLAEENMPAYAAVKFRPAQGNAEDYQIGAASAFPIMRVEEMYFIEAEAAAHQDAARGLSLLKTFMTTYRDAKYSTKVTATDDVVEEIVFQKRVELWGEGQTFFDIKRLDYSVTRGYPGTNWNDPLTRLNTEGRPAWMNYVMVRTEANNNQALVGMNNPDPSDLYTPWTEQ